MRGRGSRGGLFGRCAKAPVVSAKTDTKTDTDSTETWKAANRRGPRRGWQSDSSVSLMNLSPMNLSLMNLSVMNLSPMNLSPMNLSLMNLSLMNLSLMN